MVTGFETATRSWRAVDDDVPIAGRTVEAVRAEGKHLLMRFSGTPARRRPHPAHPHAHERQLAHLPPRRALAAPAPRHARGGGDRRLSWRSPSPSRWRSFSTSARSRATPRCARLGPDLLGAAFDAAEALAAPARARADRCRELLLDQSIVAGAGNVFRSEALFLARHRSRAPGRRGLRRAAAGLLSTAARIMRANLKPAARRPEAGIVTYTGLRRTTGRADPGARLWVYSRRANPAAAAAPPSPTARPAPTPAACTTAPPASGRGDVPISRRPVRVLVPVCVPVPVPEAVDSDPALRAPRGRGRGRIRGRERVRRCPLPQRKRSGNCGSSRGRRDRRRSAGSPVPLRTLGPAGAGGGVGMRRAWPKRVATYSPWPLSVAPEGQLGDGRAADEDQERVARLLHQRVPGAILQRGQEQPLAFQADLHHPQAVGRKGPLGDAAVVKPDVAGPVGRRAWTSRAGAPRRRRRIRRWPGWRPPWAGRRRC